MKTDYEMDLGLLTQQLLTAIRPHLQFLKIKVVIDKSLKDLKFAVDPFSLIIDLNIFIQQISLVKNSESFTNLTFTINEKYDEKVHLTCKINGLSIKSLETVHIQLEKKLTKGYLDISKSMFFYPIHSPNHKVNNKFFPIHHHGIPPYYAEIKKRLKSHFSSVSSYEEFADKKSMEHGIFLRRVHRTIDENIENEAFKVEQLYVALGLSRTQLYRKLKPLTKMSPAKYLIYYRLQKAKSLLQDTTYNVSQVVSMVGFSSHSYFTRAFCEQFGMNPSHMSKTTLPA